MKIDTDGHDFEVILGARNFINTCMPFVLFEVDSFASHNFLLDVKNTLNIFHESGYSKAFIYDNCGNFLGIYDLGDRAAIEKLLFYKLTKKFYYFDFLVMRDEFVSSFYEIEKDFYANSVSELRLNLL